jgi:hypothetical protein
MMFPHRHTDGSSIDYEEKFIFQLEIPIQRGSSFDDLCYAGCVCQEHNSMARVEYCRLALKKAGTFRNDLVILYLDPDQPEGVREELVQRKVSFIKINSLLRSITDRLVADGWEEISVKETEVHFKRLRPD